MNIRKVKLRKAREEGRLSNEHLIVSPPGPFDPMQVPLTPQQKIFVAAYLASKRLSPGEAALAAGMGGHNGSSAANAGWCLLQKPHVQAAIEAGMQARAAKFEIQADDVIRELAAVGFANMIDFIQVQPDGSASVDLSGLTRKQAAAISEITSEVYMERQPSDDPDDSGDEYVMVPVKKVKLKLIDKVQALVWLGKHCGVFDRQGNVMNVQNMQVNIGEVREKILGKLGG